MRSPKSTTSPLDQFLAVLQTKHPRAIKIASERILTGGSLVDATSHKAKGISESCARAALIMVRHLVSQLGIDVTLTSHEEKLLNRTKKFDRRTMSNSKSI